MATFEERKGEIRQMYASAAASQNLRLLRQAMKEHQELVNDEGVNGTEDVMQALQAASRRVLGKEVSAVNVRELVQLVSSVREDMTDSQRLTLFMEDLLSPRPDDNLPAQKAWPRPTTTSQRRIARYTQRQDQAREERRGPDYSDIDMTPNRSIGGAAWGVGLVLVAGAVIAGILYLIGQIS